MITKQRKQMSNYGGVPPRKSAIRQPVLSKCYRGKDKCVEATVIRQLGPVTYLIELESGIL